MIRTVMFNTSTNTNTPLKLLERMQNSKNDFNIDFKVSVFDQFGNKYSGIFDSLDSNSSLLTLIDSSDDITFFNMKYITHLILHDSSTHSNFIAGNLPQKNKNNKELINIDEKTDLIKEMLNKNYSLEFEFKYDGCDKLNKTETEKISTLLDFLTENIKDLASDDFFMSSLKKVKEFHFHDKKDVKFSMRLSGAEIYITMDFNQQLPKNINNLIEKGFNKVL